jgi:elongation factor Ts
MVADLRAKTGAGMMDCKKALEENDGDIESAKQWLREKGLAASAKREDREASQGVVSLVIDGNVGAIVELKSETDFVAGSDQFKAEADALATALMVMGPERARRFGEANDLALFLVTREPEGFAESHTSQLKSYLSEERP